MGIVSWLGKQGRVNLRSSPQSLI
uniref:Uncharacterized protein n=1 Tax=Arundo donax TaxID=35708 RepID=A0A0A9FQJ1_ARUDO